ncbi:unnamed protein product [marine sediment metagenome]|uniref:Uncharacterized protein n=1 Tax=marine sediment metagenome TaxID=412755 RepID=X1H7Q7_9ZZZZ
MTASFYELCPYIYEPYIGPPGLQETLINMDSWHALPDDLKAILKAAFGEHVDNCYMESWRSVEEAYSNFDKWGTTVITFSDEDVAKIRKASLPFMDEFSDISPRMAKATEIMRNYQRSRGYID